METLFFYEFKGLASIYKDQPSNDYEKLFTGDRYIIESQFNREYKKMTEFFVINKNNSVIKLDKWDNILPDNIQKESIKYLEDELKIRFEHDIKLQCGDDIIISWTKFEIEPRKNFIYYCRSLSSTIKQSILSTSENDKLKKILHLMMKLE